MRIHTRMFLVARLALPGLVAAPWTNLVAAQVPVISDSAPAVQRSLLSTTYHSVQRIEYEHYVTNSLATGGGLTSVGDGYLLGTGDGELYLFTWNDADSLTVDTLRQRVPINSGVFRSEVGIRNQWFRVADVYARVAGGRVRVFATHHVWKSDEECFVLRVSVMEAQLPLTPGREAPWSTVYDTQPCVSLKVRGHPFAGIQSGGRMALLNDGRLLVTVGDHQFDGVFDEKLYPQDMGVDYGKTLLVSIGNQTADLFTSGHRNQQGLLVDPDGTIWLTEHGPKGGDELNVLRQGANYGWPLATYGTEYRSTRWPVAVQHGEHDGFEKPFFSWVPSIGVSGLLRVRGEQFEDWRGDLLISTLLTESVFRMRIRDGRVAYVEQIEIGKRIRDVEEGADGRIVLWTEEGTIVSLRPDPSTDVALAAYGICIACHVAGDGTNHRLGPDLFGIVGKEIAASPTYEYSPALSAVGGVWTEASLDAFFENPEAFAPGTAMKFEGIGNADVRAKLIAYLKTLK